MRSLALIWLLRCVAAVVAAAPLSAVAQERVALVIGNSTYSGMASLRNAGNDATAMARMFHEAGFKVQFHSNLTNAETRRALNAFSDIAQTADVAAIYYAGHGIEIDGTNYLIPVDAKLAHVLDVQDEAVDLKRLLKTVEASKRVRLVILDACRDNPFVRTMAGVRGRSVGRGLKVVWPEKGDTIIAYAAAEGAIADDGDKNETNSPFAQALLKHLPTPGLDFRIAFGLVRDEVKQLTRQRQEPFVYQSMGGGVVSLVPNKVAVPLLRPAYDPNEAALAWNSIKDNPTMAQLEAINRRYGDTVYGDFARDKIEELKQAAQKKPQSDNRVASLDAPVSPKGGIFVPPPGVGYWDMGPSTVYVEASGENRKIIFYEPSSDLRGKGVQPGHTLFTGRLTGKDKARRYEGKLYARSAQCGDIPFDASGPVCDNLTCIELQGNEPQLDAQCRVIGQKPVHFALNFKYRR